MNINTEGRRWDEIMEFPFFKFHVITDEGVKLTYTCEVTKLRLKWMVYVNGFFEGVYTTNGHPFNKYMHEIVRKYPSNKTLSEMKKGLSKRFIKEHPGFFKQHITKMYTPIFPSKKAIKSRLAKTCSSITILLPGDEEARRLNYLEIQKQSK